MCRHYSKSVFIHLRWFGLPCSVFKTDPKTRIRFLCPDIISMPSSSVSFSSFVRKAHYPFVHYQVDARVLEARQRKHGSFGEHVCFYIIMLGLRELLTLTIIVSGQELGILEWYYSCERDLKELLCIVKLQNQWSKCSVL